SSAADGSASVGLVGKEVRPHDSSCRSAPDFDAAGVRRNRADPQRVFRDRALVAGNQGYFRQRGFGGRSRPDVGLRLDYAASTAALLTLGEDIEKCAGEQQALGRVPLVRNRIGNSPAEQSGGPSPGNPTPHGGTL